MFRLLGTLALFAWKQRLPVDSHTICLYTRIVKKHSLKLLTPWEPLFVCENLTNRKLLFNKVILASGKRSQIIIYLGV